MAEIRKGDYVRITIEGFHEGVPVEVGTHDDSRSFEYESGPGDTVTVERIEPPVETFGPGDVVQDRYFAAPPTLLVENGYVELYEGDPPRFFEYDKAIQPDHFDSAAYEKVDLQL